MTYRPASDEEIAQAVAEAAKLSDETMPPTDPDCARQVIALIRQLGGDVHLNAGPGEGSKVDVLGAADGWHDRRIVWDADSADQTLLTIVVKEDEALSTSALVDSGRLLPLGRAIAEANGYTLVRKTGQ